MSDFNFEISFIQKIRAKYYQICGIIRMMIDSGMTEEYTARRQLTNISEQSSNSSKIYQLYLWKLSLSFRKAAYIESSLKEISTLTKIKGDSRGFVRQKGDV
jgi:hypothetical protein